MSQNIPLPRGLFAIVDDDDFERVSRFRWSVSPNGYVVCSTKKSDGSWATQLLSRFIMNAPDGVLVDHKKGNKFDNRKSKLRFCTKSQNGFNRGKTNSNTSGFKGVWWDKWNSKWRAGIMVNWKQIHLGRFTDINEAAAAYAEAAKKYHGKFART